MEQRRIFIDRRHQGEDRRIERDPCKNMPIDIYHRKRRKRMDRRHPARTLLEDYMAYLGDLESKSSH